MYTANKEGLVRLTQDLYHLTLLFPRKEPLRYKMREVASDIAAFFLAEEEPSEKALKTLLSSMRVLDGFFEIAKSQNWTSPADLLRLQREYKALQDSLALPQRKEVPKEDPVKLPAREQEREAAFALNERQERILSFLKERDQAQVWEIKEFLPDVTKRTLRRDFQALLHRGVIERVGERSATYYKIRSV